MSKLEKLQNKLSALNKQLAALQANGIKKALKSVAINIIFKIQEVELELEIETVQQVPQKEEMYQINNWLVPSEKVAEELFEGGYGDLMPKYDELEYLQLSQEEKAWIEVQHQKWVKCEWRQEPTWEYKFIKGSRLEWDSNNRPIGLEKVATGRFNAICITPESERGYLQPETPYQPRYENVYRNKLAIQLTARDGRHLEASQKALEAWKAKARALGCIELEMIEEEDY